MQNLHTGKEESSFDQADKDRNIGILPMAKEFPLVMCVGQTPGVWRVEASPDGDHDVKRLRAPGKHLV